MGNSAMRFFAFVILAVLILVTGFAALGATAGLLS